MKKIILLIVAIVVVIVGGIFLGKLKSDENSDSKKVVKIGYLQIVASYPLFIAQANHSFENAGINIEPILLQSSNQLIDALNRGDIDVIAGVSFVPFFTADAVDPGKGQIMYELSLTPEKPFDTLIVGKDSSVKTLKELEGKKIGTFPGTTQRAYLKTFLSRNNVDGSNIQYIELLPQNQLTALQAGSIDALFAIEPMKTIALSQGARGLNRSTYAEVFNNSPFAGGVIATKFVKENPFLAKKVVDILSETNTFLLENETESRKIIGDVMKLDKPIADKVVINEYRPIDKEGTAKFVDFLISIGELKSKPDLTNIFYSN